MMRDKLATVIGFGALTLILTAGAAQSLSGSNTVYSDDIVNGQVGFADLKAGAVYGSRLADSSVTGAKVRDASLTSTDVVLTCPSGTSRVGGICFGPEQAATHFKDAITACNSHGMYLPTLSQGMLVIHVSAGSDQLWVDDAFQNGGNNEAIHTETGGYNYEADIYGGSWPYRCVTPIGARTQSVTVASSSSGVRNTTPAP